MLIRKPVRPLFFLPFADVTGPTFPTAAARPGWLVPPACRPTARNGLDGAHPPPLVCDWQFLLFPPALPPPLCVMYLAHYSHLHSAEYNAVFYHKNRILSELLLLQRAMKRPQFCVLSFFTHCNSNCTYLLHSLCSLLLCHHG